MLPTTVNNRFRFSLHQAYFYLTHLREELTTYAHSFCGFILLIGLIEGREVIPTALFNTSANLLDLLTCFVKKTSEQIRSFL